jgi:hypothetical protein
MHMLRGRCGAALAAVLFTGNVASSAPGQKLPVVSSGNENISANEILTGTFACLLGPIAHRHDASSGDGRGGMQGKTQAIERWTAAQRSPRGKWSAGFTAERCITAVEAAGTSLSPLVRFDATAIQRARGALERQLAEEGTATAASNDVLAFFDKGVAAAKEARRADEALFGHPASGAQVSTDDVRSFRKLAALHEFGRNQGGSDTGTEARALAWIIGVDRFMSIADVPAQQRVHVAEPFFSVLLNVEAPALPSGRAAPSWNDYLAAAARSTGHAPAPGPGAKAIGGGPSDVVEEANLKEIARASKERLDAIGQKLPRSSDLRAEIERTVANLGEFELRVESSPPSAK